MDRFKVAALAVISPLLAVVAFPILLFFLIRDWDSARLRNRNLRHLRSFALLTAAGLVMDAILISCLLYAPYILVSLAVFWIIALLTKDEI